jgi:hypothetical protein
MFTAIEGILAIVLLTLSGFIVAFAGIYYRLLIQKNVLDWIERIERKRREKAEASEKGLTPVYKKIKY